MLSPGTVLHWLKLFGFGLVDFFQLIRQTIPETMLAQRLQRASWSLGRVSQALAAANPSMQLRAASGSNDVHSTTVLCVRKDGEVVLVADGQVTQVCACRRSFLCNLCPVAENAEGSCIHYRVGQ